MLPPRARLAGPVLALTLAAGAARSEEPLPALSQRIQERWTYREGLPHNTAHRVLMSRSGYVWIGTQEGLVRFDGVRFRTFTRRSTPGLAGDEINAMAEDADGTLWIGTSRGLSRLRQDAFERVELGADVAVLALAVDGEGGVWVGGEAGLRHVRAGAAAVVEPVPGLPSQRVLAVARAAGEVLVGGYAGLSRLVAGRAEPVPLGAPTGAVTSLLEAPDGTLWVGADAGLRRRRPGADGFEPVPLPPGAVAVAELALDRGGVLWVGTDGGPLLRVAGGRAEPVEGTGSPRDVHALAADGEGGVWIGTESDGLHRIRWGPAVTLGREEGLSADVVWAVREGRGGEVWIATDVGLDRLAGGRVEPVSVSGLGRAGAGGLLEDRSGALWIGTVDGIVRLGPGGASRFGKADGLSGALVRTLHQDAQGAIWAGTSHGLFRLEGQRFRAVANVPALDSDKINAIAEGPGGVLWVGTTAGLARVEGDTLAPVLDGAAPLLGDVTALLADPDGGLWVGLVGDGLVYLPGGGTASGGRTPAGAAEGRATRFTVRDGLHEDTVLAILDDGEGELWLSGTHGITRVARAELAEVATGRRTTLSPTILGTAEGMRERECNGGDTPAAWRGADGRLWFATIRGVVVVDPRRLGPRPAPPPARVEELVADGRAWPAGEAPRLPAGTRRVDLRFTGLAPTGAERLRFRHRLVGLDDGFVDAEAGAERVAHFTNLPPGAYAFEVQARHPTGEWGPTARLAFGLAPRFWQTGWFLWLCAAAGLGLGLAVHLARTAALRRNEVLLAARVEEEMRKVKILSGLLPACAWCKRIRDEGGEWRRFEDYVSAHTDAQFTHGMCPECFARTGGHGEGEG